MAFLFSKRSDDNQKKDPPLPSNAMNYDEFMKKYESKQLSAEEIQFTSGYYQFGPYGDLCRAYEPILRKHFPKLNNSQIEEILKDLTSAAFELLDPSSNI